MLLVLVRHGESVANSKGIVQGHRDYPLSDRGRKQAKILARRLSSWPRFDALYTSDLKRARETAEIVTAEIGISPVVLRDFREIGLGVLEGCTVDEFKELYPELFEQIVHKGVQAADIPGREPQDEFRRRVKGVYGRLVEQHTGKRVLVITHGGFIRNLIGYLFGLDGAAPILCHNTSLNIVEVLEGRWLIHTLNDVCHLSGAVT